jgi:multiple sugar transport system substrate-binding protein
MACLHSKQWKGRATALALIVAFCLTACKPADSAVVLEFWALGREGELVSKLLPDFERRHPGVRVEVQVLPWSGAHEKLLTAVVGERAPDLAQLGNTWIPEFATIGALEPLGVRVEQSRVIEQTDYFPGIWDTNRFDEGLYGVPWYVDTRLLFYRQDLLTQAGFEHPPQCWSEWQAMLTAILARMRRDQFALFLPLNEPEPLVAFALEKGQPLLRQGGRFGNFRGAGFLSALEFYVDLFQRGTAPTAGTSQIANLWDEFARGNFVFFVSGPWQIGELRRRLSPAFEDKWATAPLPGKAGPGASLAGGASLVVFQSSPRKELAWQLIEYLALPEVQRRFYELSGDLPPRRASWQGAPLALDPKVDAFRRQLERVEPTPRVPEWERIQSEVAQVAERAARGLVDVDAAARALDQKSDRILDKRRWILAREERQ